MVPRTRSLRARVPVHASPPSGTGRRDRPRPGIDAPLISINAESGLDVQWWPAYDLGAATA